MGPTICVIIKKKEKSFKMYKFIEISNILWNLVVTVVTAKKMVELETGKKD